MSKQGKNIVISIVGSVLDYKGKNQPKRFYQWRPNFAIALHDDLAIDQYDFIYDYQSRKTKNILKEDILGHNPDAIVNTHKVTMRDPWDFGEVYAKLHDFAVNYPFEEENNYYIHITTGTHVAQICLFLLVESHFLRGKLLQTSPDPRASDKALGTYSVVDLDLSKYDHLQSRFFEQQYSDQTQLKSGIATQNKAYNTLIAELEQVAINAEQPILLLGSTGVGKSQLAKRIFALKKQRQHLTGELVSVNCATLRGDHALSTLFGHSKGAFTGAISPRAGLLKKADKGVLFLDEIGELGLDEQAMLLRAIEEKIFTPFGSDTETHSDFQLIAGTNKNLHQAVKDGTFREDLLARLNIWTYRLPTLAERREDIAPNIDYELAKYTQTYRKKIRFNRKAKSQYLRFAESDTSPWHSNFRDLNASIIRMAVLSEQGIITETQVSQETTRLQHDWQQHDTDNPNNQGVDLSELIEEFPILSNIDTFDQVQLAHVIKVCRTSKNQAEAGRKLFAKSRQEKIDKGKIPNDSHRLGQYLKKFGLRFSEINQHTLNIQ
ncbi:MAG: RNA repair transcriptional activator RtcR [Gammaproteobacteria bacterium]|nr:RNA repair transcriptional activator RtcR [Gammaproteobacteria bacterium]